MRQEAELFAEEDIKRKELVELKNQAETLFYNYGTTLKTNGQFINDELKAEAKTAATTLRSAIANPDIPFEEMKQQIEVFQQMLYSLGSAIYENSGGAPLTSVEEDQSPQVIDSEDTVTDTDTVDDFSSAEAIVEAPNPQLETPEVDEMNPFAIDSTTS